jgi:hypothetical protein
MCSIEEITQIPTNIPLISVYGNKECVLAIYSCINKNFCSLNYTNKYLVDDIEIRLEGLNCKNLALKCQDYYMNNITNVIPIIFFFCCIIFLCFVGCCIYICKTKFNNRQRVVPLTITTSTTIIRTIIEIENIEEIETEEIHECIICYTELKKFVKIICNHKLCKNCYIEMKRREINKCPLCRINI